MSPATASRTEPVSSAPGSALVRVEKVSKAYCNGAVATDVLSEVSLELARGETTSLVGVSGSGKSTLISLLAGLLTPDSGRIVFDGVGLGDIDDQARAHLRAERVGLALQSDNLIPFLTARENVQLALDFGGRGSPSTADEKLAELGLGDRRNHLPRQLSGGEAQRVALAMALANEPDLLLADEIVGELDSATAEQVLDIVFDAWRERGLTVLLVTHSAELAQSTQHQLRLADGRVHSA